MTVMSDDSVAEISGTSSTVHLSGDTVAASGRAKATVAVVVFNHDSNSNTAVFEVSKTAPSAPASNTKAGDSLQAKLLLTALSLFALFA